MDSSASYVGRGGHLTALVGRDGLTLAARGHAVSMRLLGAARNPHFVAEKPVEGVTNYYFGSRAITGLAHYGRLRVQNARPGIDVLYYGNGREIEYDLAIHPGADPHSIRIRFDGAGRPALDNNGDIILTTSWGELRQQKPRVWQGGQEIACRYAITPSGDVRLLLGPYRRSADLVIDPILSFSTYLGGNGDDETQGIAVDSGGGVYVAGSTTSTNFPVTNSTAYQCCSPDIFVTKMNSFGTALVYSTYISVQSSQANAIAVDSTGNAYITGYTSSNTFPLTFGQFGGGQDAFVVKMGSSGNVLYSTIIGGSSSDFGNSIAVDSLGAAYVVGTTQSVNFPRTATPLRANLGGNSDAFIVKLQPSGQVSYSTNFGGSGDEVGQAVAVDASGNAYVAGGSFSADFPATAGVYSTALKGGQDAFVAEINPSGSAFVYATFLGGSQSDIANGIAVDTSGAYVTGTTQSQDFPTFAAFLPTKTGPPFCCGTGFVTKLNPSGSALVYSSYLGGGGIFGDTPVAIRVDASGAAFVAGSATSTDFPTTPGALKRFKPNQFDDSDLFLVKIAPDGMSLTYATLLGSSGQETAKALAIDGNQGVYLTGITTSATFPTTAGAFEPSNPKGLAPYYNSGFVARIDLGSPTLCNGSVNPPSLDLPGRGGAFSFDLTLPAGCPWEALPDSPITLVPPLHGMGSSSTIPFSGTVAVNDNTSSGRTLNVRVGNSTFTINQAAGRCADPVFNPAAPSFDATGGLRSITLLLPSNCSWTAVPSAPWISVISSPTGAGPATITIYVAPNNFSLRTGALTVFGKPATITQAGSGCAASAVSSVTSFLGAGGTGVARVTTNPSTCVWTAYSLAPWIQLSGTITGQSVGGVPFIVSGNPGSAPRSGQILIADQLVTINQGAGPFGAVSSYTTSLFAGGNFPSSSFNGDGGPATAATLNNPQAVAVDPATGDVYIAERDSGRVRVVTPDGVINTIAGGGSSLSDNILATQALLSAPAGLALDGAGSIYISDATRVRKITQGVITTVAGGLSAGFQGDNGPATSALFRNPSGLAVDKFGNIFIADSGNNRIREVTGGTIIPFAGGGSVLGDNGPATGASLLTPVGLSLDVSGNLLVADSGNSRIRKIAQGTITTVAGGGSGADGGPAISASLANPTGVAVDASGSIFIADYNHRSLRKVTAGLISTITSTNSFQLPQGVAVDSAGRVYDSDDSFPYAVRLLTPVPAFCTYSVLPPPVAPIGGGAISLIVTTQAGCNWSASSDLPWATTSSTGTGSGMASIVIAPSGGGLRSGIVYIAGQALTITQSPVTIRNPRDIRGTGISDALIYDPTNGQSYTALSNSNGSFTYVPNLFTPGFDTLRFCDFNGDGRADLVLYNSATALAYIGTGQGNGSFTFQSLFWGPGYDRVVAGDLNGDGRSDFVLYRSSDGTLYTALSNSYGAFTYKYTLVSAGYNVTVADFNGDGKADVFLYRPSDGLANLGLSDGNGGFSFTPLFVSPGYDAVQTGDLDGDAKADLLLYSSATGAAAVGLSNGAGFVFTPQTWSPGFTAVRLLDFNGDGKADAALYNRNTSIGYLGAGNGTGSFAFLSLFWGPGYDNVDVLDLNGDGKMDVILYNSQNAASYTGISVGNPANPFTYQYSYWGTNRLFAK